MQLSYGSIEQNRLPAGLVDRFYIFSLPVFHFFCRSFPRRSLTVVRKCSKQNYWKEIICNWNENENEYGKLEFAIEIIGNLSNISINIFGKDFIFWTLFSLVKSVRCSLSLCYLRKTHRVIFVCKDVELIMFFVRCDMMVNFWFDFDKYDWLAPSMMVLENGNKVRIFQAKCTNVNDMTCKPALHLHLIGCNSILPICTTLPSNCIDVSTNAIHSSILASHRIALLCHPILCYSIVYCGWIFFHSFRSLRTHFLQQINSLPSSFRMNLVATMVCLLVSLNANANANVNVI